MPAAKEITMRVLSAACAALSCSAALAADMITVGSGAEYTSGKYGSSEKTKIWYLPFTAKFETGPWTFRGIVPYLRVTGPGNVLGVGADRVTLPGGGAPRTASGLGDIVASAFYTAVSESRAPLGLDVGAKIKFGSADETKGLGTGERDVSLQADFFRPLGRNLTAFATIGFRWYGDPPGLELRDVPYAALGAAYRTSRETSVGAVYDFRPRVTGSEISEITAYLSQRVGIHWKLQVYGVVGFSDASPDWGAGLALTYTY
jgi:hypothetical protein